MIVEDPAVRSSPTLTGHVMLECVTASEVNVSTVPFHAAVLTQSPYERLVVFACHRSSFGHCIS